MRLFLAVLFALALFFLAAAVALDANVAQFGAFNTRPGGVAPATETLILVVSTVAEVGALLLLAGAVFVLVHATLSKKWIWLAMVLVLVPVSLYAFLKAGFEANVLAGLVSLLAPIACLAYALTVWPARRKVEQAT